MYGLSLETCMQFSVALTPLELLTFDAKKLGGYVTLATPPFRKNLRCHHCHVWTVPGNMFVKSEVRSFNCFRAINI